MRVEDRLRNSRGRVRESERERGIHRYRHVAYITHTQAQTHTRYPEFRVQGLGLRVWCVDTPKNGPTGGVY